MTIKVKENINLLRGEQRKIAFYNLHSMDIKVIWKPFVSTAGLGAKGEFSF